MWGLLTEECDNRGYSPLENFTAVHDHGKLPPATDVLDTILFNSVDLQTVFEYHDQELHHVTLGLKRENTFSLSAVMSDAR